MIIHVCYNENCRDFVDGVNQFCQQYPGIEVFSYNEDHYKEKKKSYKIKGGYSARALPFVLITNKDKAYIKAFYSEDKGCTLDNLKNFLNK